MAAVMFVALCLATVSSADGHQIESQPPPEIQAQLTPILAAADRFFEGQQYAQAQAALEEAVALWPVCPSAAQFELQLEPSHPGLFDAAVADPPMLPLAQRFRYEAFRSVN